MFDEWVSDAVRKAGISNAELARRLTERLGRGIDRAAVQKMTQGKRGVAADEALAISEIAGIALPGYDLLRVPVISWVSAGRLQEEDPVTQVENDGWLPIAGLGRGDYFATVVRGSSMDRVSPEGAVIVVDRSMTDLQHGKPYLFSLRGEVTYKLWDDRLVALMPFSTIPHDAIPIDPDNDILTVIGRVRRSMLDL